MKNKVILIGAINEGNIPTCGETMKNQLFVKRFSELFDKVITIDTLNWQRRPWVLIKMFLTLLFNRKAKVVISASGSAAYLIKFLYYIPLKKNVYFWVVGGDIAKGVANGLYDIKSLKNLRYILVQGKSMVEELAQFGLTNVRHVPNSKPITFEPAIEPKAEDAAYRFVFLSRVHPHKGIKEICEAATMLNNDGLSNRFSVDFYGKIEPSYEEEFTNLIQSVPNLTYKGFLNLTNNDGYQTLSGYDVMLFPTYWGGEGFPGIVIDANIAGLPIIASDWNMNREVIEDGKTGFIIPVHDSEALADYMKKFIYKEIELLPMRRYCVEYVKQYDYRNVISQELMCQLEFMK
jgi:glycosyltransferase involved in cell wall biosynthesis